MVVRLKCVWMCLSILLVGGSAWLVAEAQDAEGKEKKSETAEETSKHGLTGDSEASQAFEGGGGPPMGPPPAKVQLSEVKLERLQQKRQVLGELRALRKTTIAAEVEGRVKRLYVTEGKFMKVGDLVAELDDTWINNSLAMLEVRLKENEALQKEDKALLKLAQRDRDQMKELAKTTIRTMKEYQDSVDRAEAANAVWGQHQIAANRIEVEKQRLQEQKKRLKIVAPFDGYVTRKHMEAGDYASVGDDVISFISSGTMTAILRVPETMVDHVKPDEIMDVLITPLNLRVKGPVKYIVPEILSGARSYPVLVRLDDQKGRLKPGMSITADIATSVSKEVFTVPRDAVLRINGETYVWKGMNVGPKQRIASKLPVRVLFGAGKRVAIEPYGNLTADDWVVIEGGERIFFPGQPLMVMPKAPLPPDQKPMAQAGDQVKHGGDSNASEEAGSQ